MAVVVRRRVRWLGTRHRRWDAERGAAPRPPCTAPSALDSQPSPCAHRAQLLRLAVLRCVHVLRALVKRAAPLQAFIARVRVVGQQT